MEQTANHQLPGTVGVYGGGRMGAGIAHAFLAAGAFVYVIESTQDAARAARDRISGTLTKAAQRQALPQSPEKLLARLEVDTQPDVLANAGLVIEAVPEDTELKTKVLATIENVTTDHTWIGTNTSSLSIDGLAQLLQRPERFVGLHFFNPVPASALVEIVVGAKTAPELVQAARAWVVQLQKTAITVTDAPGFASSRLGVAIALEAMRMLEAGVATADDIDTAMTLGYKHPMGPLRTTDVVGLDVRLAIAEHLASELGSRFEPPALLREMVARGELGRKTGRGFYDWSN